jgi:hypothetical protein
MWQPDRTAQELTPLIVSAALRTLSGSPGKRAAESKPFAFSRQENESRGCAQSDIDCLDFVSQYIEISEKRRAIALDQGKAQGLG